jgi:hypothetical protein
MTLRNTAIPVQVAVLLFAMLGATGNALCENPRPIRAAKLAIVTGGESGSPELKAAEILENRLLKRSSVVVERVPERSAKNEGLMANSDVVIVVGAPVGNSLSARLMRELGMTLPTLPNSDQTHPEGFAVRSGTVDGRSYVVVAGVDDRGTLYGVGWLLRAMTYLPDAVLIPTVDAMEKPAFPMRGGCPSGPGSRARQYGNLRPRTPEEGLETMEDVMLLGTNFFESVPGLYGMDTYSSITANHLLPPDFPEEWGADGGLSRRFVCPSHPDARKALLESYDQRFRGTPDLDYFLTNSGDPGGCRCGKCMPWGGTYIRLMHEVADILHKYHPDTKILATNQDISDAGNQAIFDYLNSRDSSWLYAIRYGPASDEMQTYIRGPVNPRWFEYEGFGPLGNYLKHMHHELPRTTNIALFSDITHWMQAQYGVPNPDLALAAVYGRRSWNARPKHFHKVGREILHYAVGDFHYTEGMHDDFNKWFWYRMLWNPRQDAESITKEYCRYWFGPDARDEMVEAIFLMEETLEKPVLGNPGIARAVEVLRSAGGKIPKNLLRSDYRWRIISQKALMDRYIQLGLEQGEALKAAAGRLLALVETSSAPRADMARAVKALDAPLETPEMAAILAEAKRLGEASNTITGYRVPAMFIAPTLDLTEVGWWRKTLQAALAGGGDPQIRNAARMVLRYEDPGLGGFYDNPGWPSEAAHLVRGEPLWGFNPFPGSAKRSHYNLTYAMDRPGRGVTFAYDGLDPAADYVVRLSVGTGRDQGIAEGSEQGLEADGQILSEGFPISLDEVGLHEFALPRELTRDGTVEIVLTSASDVMPVTIANEIWLMRKDAMPWTVPR